MSLSPKKLILLGLGLILLIAIPLTVYLVQQQQETQGQAAPATRISFQPPSQTKAVGDDVTVDIFVDPGQAPNNNVISNVYLTVNYDSTKLEATASGITIDRGVLGTENLAPVLEPNTIAFSYGINPNSSTGVSQGITTNTKIGSITFKAIATTGDTPTTVSFDEAKSNALALSSDSNPDPNSNVVLPNGYGPAQITIIEATEVSPTVTVEPTVTFTPTPTSSPTPTSTPTVTATATPTPTGVGGANQVPTCSTLVLDKSASGTVPYTINFTASGTDSDGTITKVSFSFGDGTTADLIEGGGIGSSSVSTQSAHTYSTAGTFTASATFTDNSGGVSAATCSQIITITAAAGGGSPPDTGQPPVVQPTTPPTAVPTLPPTGPAETLIGIGIFGVILTLIGAVILFAL
jgi:hypothetical protein